MQFLERHKQKSSFATQGMRVKNYDLNEFTRTPQHQQHRQLKNAHVSLHTEIISTVNDGSLQYIL